MDFYGFVWNSMDKYGLLWFCMNISMDISLYEY